MSEIKTSDKMAELKNKDIKAFEKMVEDQINQRIAHLNDLDSEYCKDRWDMSKPENERNIYREMSNQVTATRQELEQLKKVLCLSGSTDWLMEEDDVRKIAHETYKTHMAVFAEGCGEPFNALAWHIYKRAFDIAKHSLKDLIFLKQKPNETINKVLPSVEELVIKIIPGDPDNENDGTFCWEIYKGMECVGEAREHFNSKEEAETAAKKEKEILEKAFQRESQLERYYKTHDEFIVCSAVNWQGKIICGRRHKDCYTIADALINGGFLERERKHQGFMTSKGRFVNRSEAFIIAKTNNQIVHRMFDDVEKGSLTSEDLFGIDLEG